MRRAGVFVGVDRTGQLQTLNDAAAGAERMHQWSLGQGMSDGSQAILLTDRGGKKVTPDMIFDAIKSMIDGPGVDQLLVYFAGHGVNINRSEHWLLSDAPVRTSAAVNVAGSVDLARYCGIPYVVFISDACRSAPEGIQAQNVRGVDVFPNDGGERPGAAGRSVLRLPVGQDRRGGPRSGGGRERVFGALHGRVSGCGLGPGAEPARGRHRRPATRRVTSCRRGFAIISTRRCRAASSHAGWSGASIKAPTPSSSHTPTGCRGSTTLLWRHRARCGRSRRAGSELGAELRRPAAPAMAPPAPAAGRHHARAGSRCRDRFANRAQSRDQQRCGGSRRRRDGGGPRPGWRRRSVPITMKHSAASRCWARGSPSS